MIKDILSTNENVKSNKKEMEILHRYFPQCFNNEDKFDIIKFQSLIKDDINITNEGYDLNFLGKNYAKLIASTDTTTIIKPDLEHNSKPENINSENIYISGDNLDGLKHLLKSYSNKIKCIYIDPPYNTGTDGFVYNDNFNFTQDELVERLSISEDEANKILDLTKRGSASHSAWLMFMASRLQLAKELLTDDGVIFISIDDNEQANLKLLCDGIFGEENMISQIIIQSNKRGQTYKQIAKTHEYLLTYIRSENSIINELKKELHGEIKEDNISEFSERELRNRNPKYGKFNRPNLFYPIYVNPNKIDKNGYSPISSQQTLEYSLEIFPFNSEGSDSCWRWGKTKLNNNISDTSENSNAVARLKSTGTYGIYEKYRKETYKAKTIWYEDMEITDSEEEDDEIWNETGVITEQGSSELRKYGMGEIFDFPKPTYLIKKALSLGSNLDSICLDFFSGSATLAESVLRLNSIKGNRKFITIQLPENLDEKIMNISPLDKAKVQKVINFLEDNKYSHTLDNIGIERIKRAAKKIKNETKADIDYGFKHYTLVEPTNTTIDKLETFDPNFLITEDNILNDFGKDSVLETWLVKDGYGFGAKTDKILLDKYTVYRIRKHLYMIDSIFQVDDMVALVDLYNHDPEFNPENIVLFGYSFNFSELEMIKKNISVLTNGIKNLKINLDIRY